MAGGRQARVKLLLLSDSLAGGGAERVMASLANYLARRHQVTLVTLFPEPDHYRLDPAVQRISFELPRVPFWLGRHWGSLSLATQGWALGGLFRQVRPQVALTFMETANLLGLVAGLRSRTPVVISERSDPSQLTMNRFHKRVYRQVLYRLAAGFVAQSQRAADWARNFLPARRIHVLPNLLPFPGQPPEPAADPDVPVVLGVGRLLEAKGQLDLVEAFAACCGEFPQWRLRLVGEGPLQEELRRRAAQPDLQGRVELAGRQLDMAAEYGQATLFAHASWAEGFPNVVWEALWHGVPCVLTDCFASRPQYLESGNQALVVPVGDRAALVEALRQLMRDRELRRRLGHQGQQVARQFGFESCGPRWEAMLEAVSAASA